ncbi:NHL repeat protein [compost metagenome]
MPTGDGQIYVCDRQNNRAQLFDLSADGKLTFVRNIAIEGKTGGLGTVTDIALSPDKKYLYVGDMMNGRIWILLRSSHEVLGSFGRIGRQAGQFTWMHSIDTDSQGNLYVTEVGTGRRVQKFVLTGLR